MPLLDHFRPPLDRMHTWRTFHGTWAVAIARLLNTGGTLPPGYYAAPFRDRDGPIEVDAAALHKPVASTAPGATQLWAPPEPAVAVAVEWPDADDSHVEVLTDDGEARLVAAIELLSPRNKDGETARKAFAAKCAEHLLRGCSVIVVDVVTARRANIQAEVFAAVNLEASAELPDGLNAASYRAVGRGSDGQLYAWPHALALGSPLPTLPLWLDEFAVPLDLDASYTAACADLQIRQTK